MAKERHLAKMAQETSACARISLEIDKDIRTDTQTHAQREHCGIDTSTDTSTDTPTDTSILRSRAAIALTQYQPRDDRTPHGHSVWHQTEGRNLKLVLSTTHLVDEVDGDSFRHTGDD